MSSIVWSNTTFKNNGVVVQYRLDDDPQTIREMDYDAFRRYEASLERTRARPPATPPPEPIAAPATPGAAEAPAQVRPPVPEGGLTPQQRAAAASQARNRRRGTGARNRGGDNRAGQIAGQAASTVAEVFAPGLQGEVSRAGRRVIQTGGGEPEQPPENLLQAYRQEQAKRSEAIAAVTRMVINAGGDLFQEMSDTFGYDIPGEFLGWGEPTTKEEPNKKFLRLFPPLPRLEHRNGNSQLEEQGTAILSAGAGMLIPGGIAARIVKAGARAIGPTARALSWYNRLGTARRRGKVLKGALSGAFRGAVYDFAGSDQHQGRLADVADQIIKGVDSGEINFDDWGAVGDTLNAQAEAVAEATGGTAANIPVLGWLVSRDDDSALWGRVKNMTEGGYLGAFVDFGLAGLRTIKLDLDLYNATNAYMGKSRDLLEAADQRFYTIAETAEDLSGLRPAAELTEATKQAIRSGNVPELQPFRDRVRRALENRETAFDWGHTARKRLEGAITREAKAVQDAPAARTEVSVDPKLKEPTSGKKFEEFDETRQKAETEENEFLTTLANAKDIAGQATAWRNNNRKDLKRLNRAILQIEGLKAKQTIRELEARESLTRQELGVLREAQSTVARNQAEKALTISEMLGALRIDEDRLGSIIAGEEQLGGIADALRNQITAAGIDADTLVKKANARVKELNAGADRDAAAAKWSKASRDAGKKVINAEVRLGKGRRLLVDRQDRAAAAERALQEGAEKFATVSKKAKKTTADRDFLKSWPEKEQKLRKDRNRTQALAGEQADKVKRQEFDLEAARQDAAKAQKQADEVLRPLQRQQVIEIGRDVDAARTARQEQETIRQNLVATGNTINEGVTRYNQLRDKPRKNKAERRFVRDWPAQEQKLRKTLEEQISAEESKQAEATALEEAAQAKVDDYLGRGTARSADADPLDLQEVTKAPAPAEAENIASPKVELTEAEAGGEQAPRASTVEREKPVENIRSDGATGRRMAVESNTTVNESGELLVTGGPVDVLFHTGKGHTFFRAFEKLNNEEMVQVIRKAHPSLRSRLERIRRLKEARLYFANMTPTERDEFLAGYSAGDSAALERIRQLRELEDSQKVWATPLGQLVLGRTFNGPVPEIDVGESVIRTLGLDFIESVNVDVPERPYDPAVLPVDIVANATPRLEGAFEQLNLALEAPQRENIGRNIQGDSVLFKADEAVNTAVDDAIDAGVEVVERTILTPDEIPSGTDLILGADGRPLAEGTASPLLGPDGKPLGESKILGPDGKPLGESKLLGSDGRPMSESLSETVFEQTQAMRTAADEMPTTVEQTREKLGPQAGIPEKKTFTTAASNLRKGADKVEEVGQAGQGVVHLKETSDIPVPQEVLDDLDLQNLGQWLESISQGEMPAKGLFEEINARHKRMRAAMRGLKRSAIGRLNKAKAVFVELNNPNWNTDPEVRQAWASRWIDPKLLGAWELAYTGGNIDVLAGDTTFAERLARATWATLAVKGKLAAGQIGQGLTDAIRAASQKVRRTNEADIDRYVDSTVEDAIERAGSTLEDTANTALRDKAEILATAAETLDRNLKAIEKRQRGRVKSLQEETAETLATESLTKAVERGDVEQAARLSGELLDIIDADPAGDLPWLTNARNRFREFRQYLKATPEERRARARGKRRAAFLENYYASTGLSRQWATNAALDRQLVADLKADLQEESVARVAQSERAAIAEEQVEKLTQQRDLLDEDLAAKSDRIWALEQQRDSARWEATRQRGAADAWRKRAQALDTDLTTERNALAEMTRLRDSMEGIATEMTNLVYKRNTELLEADKAEILAGNTIQRLRELLAEARTEIGQANMRQRLGDTLFEGMTRNIGELRETIRSLEEQLKQAAKRERDDTVELLANEGTIRNLQNRNQDLIKKVNDSRAALDQKETDRQQWQNLSDTANRRASDAEAQVKQRDTELKQANEEIDGWMDLAQTLEEQRDAWRREAQSGDEKAFDLERKIRQWERTDASSKERITALESERDRLAKAILQMDEKSARIEPLAEQAKQRVEELEGQLKTEREKRAAAEKQRDFADAAARKYGRKWGAERANLLKQLDETKGRVIAATERADALRSQLTDEIIQQRAAEKEANRAQARAKELQQDLRTSETRAQNREAQAAEKVTTLRKQLADELTQQRAAEKELNAAQARVEKLEQDLEAIVKNTRKLEGDELARKQAAEKELNAAKARVTELEQGLSTITSQAQTLEGQVVEAINEVSSQLGDELRQQWEAEKDLNAAQRQVQDLESQLRTRDRENLNLQQERDTKQAELEALDARLEDLEDQAKEAKTGSQRELDTITSDHNALKERVQTLEGQLKTEQGKRTAAEKQGEAYRRELAKVGKRLRVQRAVTARQGEKIVSLLGTIKEDRSNLGSVSAKLEKLQGDASLQKLYTDALKKVRDGLYDAVNAGRQREATLTSERDALQSQFNEANADLQSLRATEQSQQDAVIESQQRVKQLENDKRELATANTLMEMRLTRLKQINDRRAELEQQIQQALVTGADTVDQLRRELAAANEAKGLVEENNKRLQSQIDDLEAAQGVDETYAQNAIAELDKRRTELVTARSQVRAKVADNNTLKTRLDEANTKLADETRLRKDAETKLTQQDNRIQKLEEKLPGLQQTVTDTTAKLNEAESEIAGLAALLDDAAGELDRITEEGARLQESWEAKGTLDGEALEAAVWKAATMTNKYIDARNAYDGLRTRILESEGRADTLLAELNRARDEITRLSRGSDDTGAGPGTITPKGPGGPPLKPLDGPDVGTLEAQGAELQIQLDQIEKAADQSSKRGDLLEKQRQGYMTLAERGWKEASLEIDTANELIRFYGAIVRSEKLPAGWEAILKAFPMPGSATIVKRLLFWLPSWTGKGKRAHKQRVAAYDKRAAAHTERRFKGIMIQQGWNVKPLLGQATKSVKGDLYTARALGRKVRSVRKKGYVWRERKNAMTQLRQGLEGQKPPENPIARFFFNSRLRDARAREAFYGPIAEGATAREQEVTADALETTLFLKKSVTDATFRLKDASEVMDKATLTDRRRRMGNWSTKEVAAEVVGMNQAFNRQLEGNTNARSFEGTGVPAINDSNGEIVKAIVEAPASEANIIESVAGENLALPPASVGRPVSGSVADFPIEELRLRPDLFGAQSEGNKISFKSEYKPQSAGELQVWFDANGELGEVGATYLVNGFRRLQVAKTSQVEAVNVRYLGADIAPTAQEAAVLGGLHNAVERGGGRLKAVNLAAALRQPGVTPAIRKTFSQAPRFEQALKLSRLPSSVFIPIQEGLVSQSFRDKALALGDRDLPADILGIAWNAAQNRNWSAAKIKQAVWEVEADSADPYILFGAADDTQLQRRITIRTAVERNNNIKHWKLAASSPQVREIIDEMAGEMTNNNRLEKTVRDSFAPRLKEAVQHHLEYDLGITNSTPESVVTARAEEYRARQVVNQVRRGRGKPEVDTTPPPTMEGGEQSFFAGLPIPDLGKAISDLRIWGFSSLAVRSRLAFDTLSFGLDIRTLAKTAQGKGIEDLTPDRQIALRKGVESSLVRARESGNTEQVLAKAVQRRDELRKEAEILSAEYEASDKADLGMLERGRNIAIEAVVQEETVNQIENPVGYMRTLLETPAYEELQEVTPDAPAYKVPAKSELPVPQGLVHAVSHIREAGLWGLGRTEKKAFADLYKGTPLGPEQQQQLRAAVAKSIWDDGQKLDPQQTIRELSTRRASRQEQIEASGNSYELEAELLVLDEVIGQLKAFVMDRKNRLEAARPQDAQVWEETFKERGLDKWSPDSGLTRQEWREQLEEATLSDIEEEETFFSGLPIPDFRKAIKDIQVWGIDSLPLKYRLAFGELFAIKDASPEQRARIGAAEAPDLSAGMAKALEQIRPNREDLKMGEFLRAEDQRITTEIRDTRTLMADIASEEGVDLAQLRDLEDPQWQQLTATSRSDIQSLMEAEHLLLEAQGGIRAEAAETLARIQPVEEPIPSPESVATAVAQLEQIEALNSPQQRQINLQRARLNEELREVRRQKQMQEIGTEALAQRREALKARGQTIQDEAIRAGEASPEAQRAVRGMTEEAAMLDTALADMQGMRPLGSLVEEEALLESQLRDLDRVAESLAPRNRLKIGGVPLRAALRILNWMDSIGLTPAAAALTDDAANAARKESYESLPPHLRKALNDLLAEGRDLSQRITDKTAGDAIGDADAEQLNRDRVTAERVGEAAQPDDSFDELEQKVKDAMPSLIASPNGLMRELDETDPIKAYAIWREIVADKIVGGKKTKKGILSEGKDRPMTDMELAELARGALRDFDMDPENLGAPARSAVDRITPMVKVLGRKNVADSVAAQLQIVKEVTKTARLADKFLNLGPDADPQLRDRLIKVLIRQVTETLKLQRAYTQVRTGVGRTLRAMNPDVVPAAPYDKAWVDAYEAALLKEEAETPATLLGHKISPEMDDALGRLQNGEPVNWNNQKLLDELKALALTMKDMEAEAPSISNANKLGKAVQVGVSGLFAIRTAGLLSSGTTFWVNTVSGIIRGLSLPLYGPVGAAFSDPRNPKEWWARVSAAQRRTGLTYAQLGKQLLGAWKLGMEAYRTGSQLWDPAGSRVDSMGSVSQGQKAVELRPGMWDLDQIGDKEFQDMLSPRLAPALNWLWRRVTFPLRLMGGADTFLKAAYGNSEHWVRLWQRSYDAMLKANDTDNIEVRAGIQADRLLAASHMDVIKNPDDPRRKRIPGAAMSDEHALRAGRAVTFTDDMLAKPEKRTAARGNELAAQQGLKGDAADAASLEYQAGGGGERASEIIKATQLIWRWPAALAEMKKEKSVGPLVNFLATFIKTPTDLVKVAMRHSPAAPLVDTWWRDVTSEDMITRQRARGEVALGSMAIAGFYFVLNHLPNLEVTGAGPSEWRTRRLWTQQMGKVPFSWRFRWDGKWSPWTSYRSAEPLASIIAVLADHRDRSASMTAEEQEREGALMLLNILGRTGATMMGKTWFQDLQEFSEMLQRTMEGPTKPGQRSPIGRWFSRQAGTFMPFSSATRRFTRDVDNTRLRIPASDPGTEFSQEIYRALPLPGWSDTRPPVLDPLTAEPVLVHGVGDGENADRIWFQGFEQFSPHSVLGAPSWPTDPVKQELAKQGVDMVGRSERYRLTQGGKLKDNVMNHEEWTYWLTKRSTSRLGPRKLTLKEALEEFIASPNYTRLPDHGESPLEVPKKFRADALREVIRPYDEYADSFFTEKPVEDEVVSRIRANLVSVTPLRKAEDSPLGPQTNAKEIERRLDELYQETTGNR